MPPATWEASLRFRGEEAKDRALALRVSIARRLAHGTFRKGVTAGRERFEETREHLAKHSKGDHRPSCPLGSRAWLGRLLA